MKQAQLSEAIEMKKFGKLENELLLTCFLVSAWLPRKQQQLDRQRQSAKTETKKAKLAFGGVETISPRGLRSADTECVSS